MPAVTEARTKSTRACARVQQPAEKKDKFNNRLDGKEKRSARKKKLRRSRRLAMRGKVVCARSLGLSLEKRNFNFSKQTARFFFENIAFPRARSRASPLSPAAADRAADRTRAPRLVSRLSARSGPDSAFLEAPFEFREALAFRRFEVSPRDREKADASHGRAVLRVACRARSGRVPAIAHVPATPRRGERPQESGRRAQRQGGDEVDGPPAVS